MSTLRLFTSAAFAVLVIAQLLLLVGGANGCIGDRCSPGQVLTAGTCVGVASDATLSDSTPPSDSSSLACIADAGTDACSAVGQACSDQQPCRGQASFCVRYPGQAAGYCTLTGCSTDTTTCPTHYSCFDLAPYGEGLPRACIRN